MRASDILRLNLITLRLFVAACEEQSISGAAVREHIAASALSRRLSELEAALGLILFRRHKRGLEPTPSAIVLLCHARVIMSDMSVMADELDDHLQVRPRLACLLEAFQVEEHSRVIQTEFRQRTP